MTQNLCPSCGKPLVKRTGKYGDFLGCSGYPKCKTIVNISKVSSLKPIEEKSLRRIETLSSYQQAIETWVKTGTGHAVVKATAGSGKTRTQEHVVAVLIEDLKVPAQDIIYLAFNSHVVKEAVDKGLPAKSTHQVGLQAVSAYTGKKVNVDDNKVSDIIKNLIQMTWDEEKWMISPVGQIVSKLKNTLAPWDNETQAKICDKFGIEVNGSSERIFDLVRQTMEQNNKDLTNIDFDDMLYMPVKYKMPIRQYKWVLGDEVQDWNRCQIELIKKLVAPNGRVLAVGDENQSMYGFRGAAPDAMQKIQEAFSAQILPLSISYRNPTSHVDLINKIFPNIKHEKSPFAKKGEILSMSMDKMLGQVEEGDLLICRNNAPLVEPVFALIRMGIKATIRGRDIGKGLIALCERFNVKRTDDLLAKLEDYRIKEVAKLLKAEKTNQAQALTDKIETIVALSEGCDWVWQITQKINEVFSDKKEGVIFSTVHRAKGDEAERVFILNPQLMPSKWAKDEESIQQEANILFVALSRAKSTLVFVGGPVPAAFESQEMWEEEEVIKQLSEILPEGTKIMTNVEIFEDGEVKFEKEVIVQEVKVVPEISKCPF